MEDFSEFLKKNLQNFYKRKTNTFGSVETRVVKMNEKRKNDRRELVSERRKLENMSPYQSPLPKMAKSEKSDETTVEKPVSKRLEMLAKWKADKEKRKLEEKKRHKPVFKVSKVTAAVGLPDLENVNREIKGKQFKSKFAPPNHKFKPPANIKPIDFTKEEPKRMVTRSQAQKLKNDAVKTNKEVTSVATPKNEPKKTNNVKSKGSKQKTPIKKSNNQSSVSLCDESEKTPKKQKPPVYISPFVTISRGKDSARKEYEARRSGKSFSAKPDAMNCTSPKAGAAYFAWRLDNEITRLKEMSENWSSYKTQNPPEEAISMIDVAIGQTNLLITKKFEQFRGLIERCQNGDSETPVSCEDLHGFWDMIYIQVQNLDKRYENLDKLKDNDWEEVVPEVKKETTKKKATKKTAKASEGLKAAIQAARRKKQSENVEKTPQERKSLVSNVISSQTNGSPGLMMMKVAQYAKGVETPSRSILKNKAEKSAKSQSKTVLFQDEIENDKNSTNLSTKTPTRRSKRLSKGKLF